MAAIILHRKTDIFVYNTVTWSGGGATLLAFFWGGSFGGADRWGKSELIGLQVGPDL